MQISHAQVVARGDVHVELTRYLARAKWQRVGQVGVVHPGFEAIFRSRGYYSFLLILAFKAGFATF